MTDDDRSDAIDPLPGGLGATGADQRRGRPYRDADHEVLRAAGTIALYHAAPRHLDSQQWNSFSFFRSPARPTAISTSSSTSRSASRPRSARPAVWTATMPEPARPIS